MYRFSDSIYQIKNDKSIMLGGGALTSIQAARSFGGYDYLDFAILFSGGKRYIVPFPKMFGNIKLDYDHYNFFATLIDSPRKNFPFICVKNCEHNGGDGNTDKYCIHCNGKKNVTSFGVTLYKKQQTGVYSLNIRNLLIDNETYLVGHSATCTDYLDFAIYIEAYGSKKYIMPLCKQLGYYSEYIFYSKRFTK